VYIKSTRIKFKMFLTKLLYQIATFNFIHCPEHVSPGKIMYELVYNGRIVEGTTKGVMKKTAGFYRMFSTERFSKWMQRESRW